MVMEAIPLLFILFVVTFSSVGCTREEANSVSVSELQQYWDASGRSSGFSSLQRSRTTKNAAVVLELKHHATSTTGSFHHELLLRNDEARVSSLHARLKSKHMNQSNQAQIPLTSGLALQTLNYIISIKLGGESMAVIVDTGSDLTWVQCKPCTYCYVQHNPIYDPSTSPTYSPLPCDSSPCASVSGGCALGSTACGYAVRYGDGSYTRGLLAKEQLGLADVNVSDFIFGCGRSNRGLFGGTSGLAGLGRTQMSLVSQTKAQFGGVFSYCLPSRVFNSSGTLVLGGDTSSYKNATPIAYTPMLQTPRQVPFYFLNLTGVRVGGTELGFQKGVRVLIDSGTVITRLVPSLYKAVRDEFVRQFAGYPLTLAYSILDTCYDLSKYEEVRVPKLGLGFEGGVEMKVDVTGMLYVVKKDASQVCLAMTSLGDDDDVGIIGNYQQKNQRVVYDNEKSVVGFAEERCSYSSK